MSATHDDWYRAPIVWFGAAILFASIAGCVLLIALALRYPDPPLPLDREPLIKVPESRNEAPAA
jgi:hypothetical protein